MSLSAGMRRSASIAAFLTLTALGIAVAAQDNQASSYYRVEAAASWDRRILDVRVVLDLRAAGLKPPAGRLEAERMIERDLPGLAKDAVFSITVDSRRTVADAVADGTLDVAELLALSSKARRIEASFDRTLTKFEARYEFRLDEIGALFVEHESPAPYPESIGWSPSRPYSGIVIYAKGSLPVHGEKAAAGVAPGLFPRIFDSAMNLVVARDLVDPGKLREIGELAYAYDEGPSLEGRIGDDPLRILAREVFGNGRTDLVITGEDARRILARPENQALIRAGRLVVLVDEAATRPR